PRSVTRSTPYAAAHPMRRVPCGVLASPPVPPPDSCLLRELNALYPFNSRPRQESGGRAGGTAPRQGAAPGKRWPGRRHGAATVAAAGKWWPGRRPPPSQHRGEEALQALGLRVVDELARGAAVDDAALVHEHHLVGDLAGEAHLMGHHDHGHAVGD